MFDENFGPQFFFNCVNTCCAPREMEFYVLWLQIILCTLFLKNINSL